ncbi:outer membrane protein assembly factor BamE [Flavobacteriaceae bacterium F08102]|nr:outer membrane protein assembly factor BamE [Flavobacteriaceae bacterium F08102]
MNTIKEGIGLGKLKFGMSRNEVESILGQPEEIETHSFPDDEYAAENWHYDELEVSLGFEEIEDWRLVTLAITAENFTFRRFHPIGMSKKEFINVLSEEGIFDLEHEDVSSEDYPNHEILSSDSLQMNFWFEEDVLSEVQWGPFFTDEDVIQWPD